MCELRFLFSTWSSTGQRGTGCLTHSSPEWDTTVATSSGCRLQGKTPRQQHWQQQPAPAAIGLHGVAVAFDPAIEDWLEYVERLSHYFVANDIVSEDKKKAILLNAVRPSTYRLIRTLASPSKVTDLSFEDIVDKARAHFCPKPSPIVKRYD